MTNQLKNDDELFQCQSDELSALKAIFCNDIRDLRVNTDANKWKALEVEITLEPMVSLSRDRDVHVKVDLYIRCGRRYPNVIPDEIALRNAKGISSAMCDELKNQLYQIAKQMRGEVMIYRLTDHVRHFLHENKCPVPKSFYDEMLENRVKLEEQKMMELAKKKEIVKMREEQQLQQLQEELQRKQHALREESRLRRESFGNDVESFDYHHDPPVNSSIDKCMINHGTQIIKFNCNGNELLVQRCSCLSHNYLSHSVEFIGFCQSTGRLLLIIEYVLQINENQQKYDYCINRINEIENLKSIICNMNHPNLVRYLSLKYIIGSDNITIYLLREHINGIAFSQMPFMSKGGVSDMHLIQNFSRDILKGLNYLHNRHFTHQTLSLNNIYFDSVSGLLKLTCYSIEYEIIELSSIIRQMNTIEEEFNTKIHEKIKDDIYQFGILLLSVIIQRKPPFKPKEIDTYKNSLKCVIDSDMYDFLSRCLELNRESRATSSELLRHNFLILNETSKENVIKPIKGDALNNFAKRNRETESHDEEKKDERTSKILINSVMPLSNTSHSRLSSEFEIIAELGEGGFGMVYKVKNILDGGHYAIKKIRINPSNRMLYQKIMREVQLLSRLNHENVVRYYCSWIETESSDGISNESDSSGSKLTNTDTTQISVKKSDQNQSDTNQFDEDDEEFEEAEEDIFGTSFIVPLQAADLSDYVVFEKSGSNPESQNDVSLSPEPDESKVTKIPRQYMCIQMELCEKSTLRDAIDDGLYKDPQRKRRLFREIVEGLTHIHQQGMIHRDLKPGNIFLDSNDSVKIGDFGLATTELVIVKDTIPDIPETDLEITGKLRSGIVGTPLYLAPELTKIADVNCNKIVYTQKVDIYSLGIILFEMSYPFKTNMERTKVILSLRKCEITLPDDCDEHLTEVEIQLLKSLLNHDKSLRLSSTELIDSEYVPGPEMEEREELNVIRRTVLNPRNKVHKYMLNLLFQKESSEVEDYVYDVNDDYGNCIRTKSSLHSTFMRQRIFEYVYSSLQNIMYRHCAVSLPLPSLIPKHSTQKYNAGDLFLIMDHNGAIVSLPYDLRVPFARYVARNRINYMRRYAIEKVYRQRRVFGYHPRELWECAFDIVAPKHRHSNHLLPDAETINVINDIVHEFPMLQGNGLTLKMNHMQLLEALLLYCDIPEDQHETVMRILYESTSNSIKYQQSTHRDSIDYTNNSNINSSLLFSRSFLRRKLVSERILTDENRINSLLQLIELESDSVKKLLSSIKTQMRKKGVNQVRALEIAKKKLKEIETILCYAERFGKLKFSVKICLNFVFGGSNFNLYSGVIYQLEREMRHKRQPTNRTVTSVIAVGGRYDDLIAQYDVMNKETNITVNKGAVGISIEFEKIMRCVLEDESRAKINTIFGERIDVVLCSFIGQNSDIVAKELCTFTKEFWVNGIKVFCFPEDLPKNIDDLHTFCIENSVRYAILLKDTLDTTISNFHEVTAKLFAYENERFIDKKGGNINDVKDYVIKNILTLKNELSLSSNAVISDQIGINRSDDINYSVPSSLASNVKVTFITTEKLQPVVRRRHENAIISHISVNLNFVTPNNVIEVIAIDLPFKVIKTIAGEIEFEDESHENKNVFEKSKMSVMDKHPRFRKNITNIMDEIYFWKIEKKHSVIVLLSITDNMRFKIIN